jgi:hypothetical protein
MAPDVAALVVGPVATAACSADDDRDRRQHHDHDAGAADRLAALPCCALQGPAASARGTANGAPPDGAGASSVSMSPLPVSNAVAAMIARVAKRIDAFVAKGRQRHTGATAWPQAAESARVTKKERVCAATLKVFLLLSLFACRRLLAVRRRAPPFPAPPLSCPPPQHMALTGCAFSLFFLQSASFHGPPRARACVCTTLHTVESDDAAATF